MLYAAQQNRLNSAMSLKKKVITPTRRAGSDAAASAVTFEDLLVAVARTRNRDAFIRLFEHFAPRVKSFLMKGGMTQELADDLAQETMLAVWQKAAQFDPLQAAASTWIFTIARNKRIDALRRTARPALDPRDPLLTPDTPAPDSLLDQAALEKKLATAIAALPEEQAALLQKSYFEDKSHAVIAAETGLPLGTVKSRLRLALERLRREFPDVAGSPAKEAP